MSANDAAPRSCASCGVSACGMHQRHGREGDATAGRTDWLLDDVWPEYASYVAASVGPEDRIIAPGLFGRPLPARYRWGGNARHVATIATGRRHWTMRRVRDAAGHVRQRAYLERDRQLALALAKAIDYRARHLVIAQAWLPWLAEAGVLGGRSYDVLMSRYPFADIHRLLDRAAKELGDAADTTISDFRAPEALVQREMEALANARRIITPHHGIAALFPLQALTLAWHRPQAGSRTAGLRTAFLGPALSRQRPDIALRHAAGLDQPLILFGPSARGFEAVAVERRDFSRQWLDDIGTIIHPATMTAQPRRLLAALAHGVQIRATAECGLDPGDYVPLNP